MSAFRVGQKVVCINTDEWTGPLPLCAKWSSDLDGLTKGEIYTVRRVGTSEYFGRAVWLGEIKRPADPFWQGEAGFVATRFRPLAYKPQSVEHDVALFETIAHQIPALNEADA